MYRGVASGVRRKRVGSHAQFTSNKRSSPHPPCQPTDGKRDVVRIGVCTATISARARLGARISFDRLLISDPLSSSAPSPDIPESRRSRSPQWKEETSSSAFDVKKRTERTTRENDRSRAGQISGSRTRDASLRDETRCSSPLQTRGGMTSNKFRELQTETRQYLNVARS